MELTHIGRYEIHARLGQGGMGTVYKARDPAMERWVAIKTITAQDVQQRARFQQEIRAAGALNHPHITTIYDVGEEGDLAYIVMELVEGDTLANHLSSPLPWPDALRLLLPICEALAYAHSRGVIHRDVKPANILIANDKQVKLSDFGVARFEAAQRRITESGSTVGTPLYTAPEQIRNESIDGRADLFSLGVVLFEAVAGQHPFMGQTLAQIIYRITQLEPADLRPLAVLAPPAYVDMVGRALQKQADARFADARQMAEAMQACLAQPESPLFHAAAPPHVTITPGPVLELVASNLALSPVQETLLRAAFAGHDRVYLEREFHSGYSQAKVLLATPVRSGGRRLAQVVLKLATPVVIKQEWQAYQDYVANTLPPVTARILEEPLYAADGQLALLRYTFAGGLGQTSPESLRAYYAQHNGEETASLLERGVFQAFGPKWWLQRQTKDLIIRREYDRLLPVHLELTYQNPAAVTATSFGLVAGKISAHTCSQLEVAQLVQLQNFIVAEIANDRPEITLTAPPPSGHPVNPIRVRVTAIPPEQMTYQVGQVTPVVIGVVTATRHTRLRQLAEAAWPEQNFTQKQLSFGGQFYPNPLDDYESLLNQRLTVMTSTIHGDLNLENILVTPATEVAWLIDFATTREGHNLFDFMRLETQVITKLLLTQTQAGPADVARLLTILHQNGSSPQQLPPTWRKPFLVLAAIRRMVKICMYNRDSWDEYYLGLIITLLGALKFKELDDSARRLALAAAATLRSFIASPTLQVTPPTNRPVPTRPPRRRAGLIISAALLGLLVVLGSLGVWRWNRLASAPTPTPVSAATVAINMPLVVPTSTPTDTPTALPTSTPTICVAAGAVLEQVEIRRGPGPAYPSLGAVPAGNSIQITGRLANSQWWQIADPRGVNGYGWVEASLVQLSSDCLPPIMPTPPPPLITLTVTASPTTPVSVGAALTDSISLSPTPKPTPVKTSPDLIMFEDFEAYDTAALRAAYNLNNAWGKNVITLQTATLPGVPELGQALAVSYEFKAAEPDNYVGLERNLAVAQNWSIYKALQLWMRNDNAPKTLIFQWGETTGEVWKAAFPLAANETRLIEIPLTPTAFSWADWSAVGNKQADLAQVNYYGIFFLSPLPAQGTIYLDNMAFVPLPIAAVSPEASQQQALPAAPTRQDTGFRPANIFAPLWNMIGQGAGPLGYPLGEAITSRNYARQPFERGLMFWWEAPEEPQPIWVIQIPDPAATQGHTWARYNDRWENDQALYPPACPDATAPLGPKSGFGVTWCYDVGVKEQLGRPLAAESGSGDVNPKAAVQFFQGGVMFENPVERQVYALVEGHGWYRLNY